MIRNLKALGFSFAALVAVSLAGASAAHALTADVGAGGQTTTGGQINVGEHPRHSFSLSTGRSFVCNTVLFDGTISNGAEEIVVTPTYSDCSSNATQPVTVTHNGCNYRIYGGEEAETNHFDNITIDLACPEGREFEAHVYSSGANHAAGTVLCTYTVPPFTENHNLTLENTTTGVDDVGITSTIGIAVKRVTGSALVCGPVEQTGTYTGASTARVYSDTAHTKQVDLSMTY